jgi:hypothetical protein
VADSTPTPPTDAERLAEVLAAHVLGAHGLPRQCACGYLLPVGPDAYLHRQHVAGLLARIVAAARADEREHWDDAIAAVQFYRRQRREARSVLDHVADRLDEHTYSEFSAVLDDDWSDDGPVDDAVAALADTSTT